MQHRRRLPLEQGSPLTLSHTPHTIEWVSSIFLLCADAWCGVPSVQAQALNLHFSKWNEWVLTQYEEAFDD
jgi:hypothetical protein